MHAKGWSWRQPLRCFNRVPDGQDPRQGAFWDLQYEHCSTSPSDPAGRLPGRQRLRREWTGRRRRAPHLRRPVRRRRKASRAARHAGARPAPARRPARGLPRLRRPGRRRDRALAWLAGEAGRGRRRRRRVEIGRAKGLTFLNVVEGGSRVSRGRRRARRGAGRRRRHQPGPAGPPWASSEAADPRPGDLVDAPPRSVLLMNPVTPAGGPRHPGRPGPDRPSC
ncbi:hypothetical protein HBB16_01155 [Pseudonocardia sp. MCCB 268]|nr:hypothetical protein [Pseudonocardia cytotoxica]